MVILLTFPENTIKMRFKVARITGDYIVRQMQDIFAEYSRMRDNGLDAKAALNVLRFHIEVLDKSDREALAALMRQRESGSTPATNNAAAKAAPPQPPPAPPAAAPKISSIKPIAKVSAPAPQSAPAPIPAVPTASAPASAANGEDVVWINCPSCGKTNQRHEVFCYACGQLLEPVKGAYDTRVLNEKTVEPLQSEFFGEDSVLVLRVRGTTDSYEMRPQKSDHEMIVGRSVKGSVLSPDIDLSNKHGADLGVSRLHLSVQYDKEHHTALVADLGSANGSYLNGQRMMPKEVRVLRHGDELRLGKLVMSVSFRHPGRAENQ